MGARTLSPADRTPTPAIAPYGAANSLAFSAVTIAVPVSTKASTASPLTAFQQGVDAQLADLGRELGDRCVLRPGDDERDLIGQRVEADEDDVLRLRCPRS